MALSVCNSTADIHGKELLEHGSFDFPMACYHDDLGAAEVPWHWHNELEAAIVTEGSAVVCAGKQKYIIRTGEAFFINTQVLHGCWDYEQSHCRFHSIAFHPRLVGGSADSVFYSKYLQPLLENQGFSSLHLKPKRSYHQDMIQHIENAWQACVYEPFGFEMKARSALSELVLLLHEYIPASQKAASARTLRNAERIKQMLQFLQEHYMDELDTASIARSASISESECLRCFRSEIGITPIQYLRQMRIQKAAQFLLSEDYKISDVASMCGFQDMSYFTKTFREIKGCSPTEYRKKR